MVLFPAVTGEDRGTNVRVIRSLGIVNTPIDDISGEFPA
jgi:hypothetical protein